MVIIRFASCKAPTVRGHPTREQQPQRPLVRIASLTRRQPMVLGRRGHGTQHLGTKDPKKRHESAVPKPRRWPGRVIAKD